MSRFNKDEYNIKTMLNFKDKSYSETKFRLEAVYKAGDNPIREEDVMKDDEAVTPEKEEKRIALKTLISVQKEFNGKYNRLSDIDVDNSKGDIRNLTGEVYSKTIVPHISNTKEVVKATTGGSSVYVAATEELLKQIMNRKSEFMKSYRKRNGSITQMTYRCSVMLLIDMMTIVSNATTELIDKNLKNFDAIISKDKDSEQVFRYATELTEVLARHKKLYVEEMKISESAMDSPLLVCDDLVPYIRENTLSISTASRLINFGLSNTVYKLFAIIRYVIYLNYHRKYSIADRIGMINKNISVLENGDIESNNSDFEESKANHRNFKVDTIEASNKTDVDIAKGETIDLDF